MKTYKSTKFWFGVIAFSLFTILLLFNKINESNYVILASMTITATFGINVLDKKLNDKS